MNAHERVETLARARIEARGLKVTRYGAAWCVRGVGVSILCAELHMLTDTDLKPFANAQHNRGLKNEY